YPAAHGIQSWVIARSVRQLLDTMDTLDEVLPDWLRRQHELPGNYEALWHIHFPRTWQELADARRRLKWEEAMAVQLAFAQRRDRTVSRSAPACPLHSDGI